MMTPDRACCESLIRFANMMKRLAVGVKFRSPSEDPHECFLVRFGRGMLEYVCLYFEKKKKERKKEEAKAMQIPTFCLIVIILPLCLCSQVFNNKKRESKSHVYPGAWLISVLPSLYLCSLL